MGNGLEVKGLGESIVLGLWINVLETRHVDECAHSLTSLAAGSSYVLGTTDYISPESLDSSG